MARPVSGLHLLPSSHLQKWAWKFLTFQHSSFSSFLHIFSINVGFRFLDCSRMETDDLSSQPGLSPSRIDNTSSPQVLENLSSPELLLVNLGSDHPDNVTWVSLVELMGNSTDWRQQLDFPLLQVWKRCWHRNIFKRIGATHHKVKLSGVCWRSEKKSK